MFLITLFGSIPAEFESGFLLEESIFRLSNASASSEELTYGSGCAYGKVCASEVVLQRGTSYGRNVFKPMFRGSFEQRNGKVVLVGKFALEELAIVIATTGLLVIALLTALTFLAIFSKPFGYSWLAPFAGIGMLFFWLTPFYLGKWLSRNDVVWLSAVIGKALSAQSA